jgi:hypothetical protein
VSKQGSGQRRPLQGAVVRGPGGAILLAAAIGLHCAPAVPAPKWVPDDGERIRYQIFDDDKPVGALDFDFSRPDASTLIIDRRQQLTIKRFMITATLEAESRQQIVSEQLVSFASQSTLESTLKDMSRSLSLTRSDDGALVGESADAPITLPESMSPLILWSRDALRSGTYFSADDGSLIELSVDADADNSAMPPKYRGPECAGLGFAMLADGKRAEGIAWTDAAGRICALRFETELGPLDYVLSAPAS